MQRFENYLKSHLLRVSSFHPCYEEALSAMLDAGGKRFRPQLLLEVVEAHNSLLYNSALPVALALEAFHTYSLIHDDLPAMDNASLRRGHETLHVKYDEATAILAGDALNTEAFLLIAKAPLRDDVRIKLVEILADNGGSGGMVLGQAIDCYFENQKLELKQIEILHQNKTAKLIAASLQMGAVIAGLSKEVERALYDFGLDLGLLFQVQDDIIDATQSEQEAGKTTNNDESKNSFVTVLGLDTSLEYANNLAKKIEDKLESFDKNTKQALSKAVAHYLWRHK
ncbi:Geranyltranstransferase (Farnesyl-diphosphate synthase) (FPP synthase) [Sulfurovum sp. enrichment culture clone C5]|uniref:Geranyltranstransferase (Farnesyl-diphosphate synthase) (FPP synthase) n=1 Tax=Sulfurovum sp. enrichment culture clone C5 TaxID=497650 RepID=A0A0S4XLA0_9BACT|nr:Geranyltranstransferase (Farnesyl-diphosphate synthase) (FPP synthase) [Sulfurovum sp. enrichment culture clone C5]